MSLTMTGQGLSIAVLLEDWRVKAKGLSGTPDMMRYTYVQDKMDGWRLTIIRHNDGIVRAYTRTQEITEKVQQCRWWKNVISKLPNFSMVEGELLADGNGEEQRWAPASEVSRRLASDPQRLSLVGFKVVFWENMMAACDVDMQYHERAFRLLALPFAEWQDIRSIRFGWLEDNDPADWLREEMKAARARGAEGLVLKENAISGWAKIKAQPTCDLVVTGLVPGKGKYKGQVGSLICSVVNVCICPKDGPQDEACPVCIPDGGCKDCPHTTSDGPCEVECSKADDRLFTEVANVGGFDDATRVAINDSDILRVCEVEYQLVGAGGRLRHPRFVRWRPDKPAKECTMDQLTQLTTGDM